MDICTSLWGTKVFSGGGCTRLAATSLLDAERAAFNHLAIEPILRGISLVGSHHLDEPETTGFAGVGVAHDTAVLHISVFFKETLDIRLDEARVNAGAEEVRALVGSFIFGARSRGGRS